MALDDPTIPRVGRNGYRVLAPLEPGTRMSTAYPDRAATLTVANPVGSATERRTWANKVAGYTR